MLPVVRAVASLCLLLLIGQTPIHSSYSSNDPLPRQKEYYRVFRQLLAKTVRTHFSRYMLWTGYPLHSVQPELWAYFLEFLDGKSLWDMSLTCKWFGALIRNEDLGIYYKWHDRRVVASILMDSDLALPDNVWKLVEPIVNFFLPPTNEEILRLMSYAQTQFRRRFVEALVRKQIGPFIARKVVKQAGIIREEQFFGFLDPWHIFVGPKPGYPMAYHYFPLSTNTKRLFDHVNSTTMTLLMSSGTRGQPQLFSFAILADYVIPALHNRREMKRAERQTFEEVYLLLRHGLIDVVNLILWALYLSKNSIHNQRLKLKEQLRYLGIFWKEIRMGCYRTIDLLNMEKRGAVPNMQSVLLIAKYFRLDYMILASHTTSISELSQQISNGNVPNYFLTNELPTSTDLFEIVYGQPPMPYHQMLNFQYQSTHEQAYVERPFKRQRLADGPPSKITLGYQGGRTNAYQPVYQTASRLIYPPKYEHVQYPYQENYAYHGNQATQYHDVQDHHVQQYGGQDHHVQQGQEHHVPHGRDKHFSALATEYTENFSQSFRDEFVDINEEFCSYEAYSNGNECIESNKADYANISESYFEKNHQFSNQEHQTEYQQHDEHIPYEPIWFDHDEEEPNVQPIQNVFFGQLNTMSPTDYNSVCHSEHDYDYWTFNDYHNSST